MSMAIDTYSMLYIARDYLRQPDFATYTERILLNYFNIIARDLYSYELFSPVPRKILTKTYTPTYDSVTDLATESLPSNFGKLSAIAPSDNAIFHAEYEDIRAHFRPFWELEEYGVCIEGRKIHFRGLGNNQGIVVYYRPAVVGLAYGTISGTGLTTTNIAVNAVSGGILSLEDDFYNGCDLAIVQFNSTTGYPTRVEIREISDYAAANNGTFTLASALTVTPTTSMKWSLVPQIRPEYHDLIYLGAISILPDSVYARAADVAYMRRFPQYIEDLGVDFPHAIPARDDQ